MIGDEAEASVRRRRFSWVWLIPAASLLIGGGLLWTNFARRGPLIHVRFDTAEGLEAGQSAVKFKDIQMGTVESFELTPDRRKVDMHIRMTRQAEPLLTEGAQFWTVKPGIFGGEVTGISTVISGSYLAMQAGEPGGTEKREFIGLTDPPSLDQDSRGRQFQLTASVIGPLSVGSPIFFRDIEVGKILGWKIVGMARSVEIAAFIKDPYADWVHDDSQFWNTSGLALKLSAEGVQLQVNSVKAALLGAVTFETPAMDSNGRQSEPGHAFKLYATREIASSTTAPDRVEFASYFTGSVGGLAVGAPVTLQGAPVGTVTAVALQFDTASDQPRVRAALAVHLDPVAVVGPTSSRPVESDWRDLVAHGLRAKLKGGNMFTGQKEVELEMDADAEPATLRKEGDTLIIPSEAGAGGGLDEVEESANRLLRTIARMPLAEIGNNLDQALHGASAIVNGRKLRDALTHLDGVLVAAGRTVRHLDEGAAPALRRLPGIAQDLQTTLANVRALSGSIGAGSAGETKFGRDLDALLTQAADAAFSVRGLADLLKRHPEALIRGRVARVAE